jgi:hypothetical protein
MQELSTVGKDTYVEYHHSPNAWMTKTIFKGYITRLNRSFARKDRKIALLIDNACVHNLQMEFSHIKIIFLPANTTSHLQPLDQGIIANFKLYYR